MKRALSITVFFVIFFLIFFLQSNFFNWYNIAGIRPNLFIVFILSIGLFLGGKYGIILGITFGILLDIIIGLRVGPNGIMLGVVGLVGGFLEKNFAKENRISFIIMIFVVTIFSEMIYYLLQIVLMNVEIQVNSFIKIILIEASFNAILSVILYPLIQKIGNIINEIFNDNINSFMKYY